MLRYLVDPANSITTTGILLSAAAINLALSGHVTIAVAVALWAMLADQFDGIVASRTTGRDVDTARMGKSLDGFSDIIYGAVVPAVCLVVLGNGAILSIVASVALIFAGAVRLSYFNNFGLSDSGRFLGVPLSYDVPLLATLLLVRPWLEPHFVPVTMVLFLILAALHVASIRIPAPGYAMYIAIVTFGVCASLALVAQTMM
jgi:CDP-diacylglycerol---serine O-phosphatidyltransferase